MFIQLQQLKTMGLNKSQIARKLNISRPTLDKYYDLDIEAFEQKLQSRNTRAKKADQYQDQILNWLKEYPDIQASQIYYWIQEKVNGDPGFAESTLRTYVRNLRKEHNIPKTTKLRVYEAIDDPPMGQQMQVDMGEQWVYRMDKITRIKLYVIAFVLSHSRYKYAKWFDRPLTTADVILAHEQAFQYFGGIPQQAVYDQDSLILTKENYGDLIYTHQFASYRFERKFNVYMCRAADPESKGRIESVIGYVKNNFAKNRLFINLEKWNEDCIKWLELRANAKIHGTTKKIPAQVFTVEKKYLKPVSEKITKYSSDTSITYQVRKDNTVLIKGNRYTVPLGTYKNPDTYVKVLEKNGEYLIYDFDNESKLAAHKISQVKGVIVRNNNHRRKRSDSIDTLFKKVTILFPNTERINDFLNTIRKEKPRYIRDQLLLIKKSAENKDAKTITKALEYCIDNKLYSASDFSDVIIFYAKEMVDNNNNQISLSTETIALNEKDKEKLATKPAVRSLKVYQKIFNS
jgi:transposase